MVRVPNQGSRLLAGKERNTATARGRHTVRVVARSSVFVFAVRGRERKRRYLAPAVLAYLRRNLSTRPAVSTIFCLPV